MNTVLYVAINSLVFIILSWFNMISSFTFPFFFIKVCFSLKNEFLFPAVFQQEDG